MKECCVVLIIGNKTNSREFMFSTPLNKLKGITIKELTEYADNMNKIANPHGGYVKLRFKMFPSELTNQAKYINKVEVM